MVRNSEEASGQGKLRRSCEGCRRYKIRCLPSVESEEKCQRCVGGNKECVFLEGKRRAKKRSESRRRVEKLEESVASLLAVVASGNQVAAVPPSVMELAKAPTMMQDVAGTSALSTLQNYTYPQTSTQIKPTRVTHSTCAHTYSQISTRRFPLFDDFQDVISRGEVSPEQAEQSLQHFRNTASSFPFVIIPDDISLNSLRSGKPCLLLAILAMAANYSLKTQKVLERELRETLGRRIFACGEKSLDLVQGMLVYLAWHHFFFEPEDEQIYHFCQSIVSMAYELGIAIPVQHGTSHPTVSFNLLSITSENDTKANSASSQSDEAQRTLLGCYYISSTLCIGLRKPNNIKYSNYIEECAQSLVVARITESDILIPYFIQMQRLANDINQTFNYDAHQETAPLDSIRIAMFVKIFAQQLNHLEKSFPLDVWQHDMLMMTYYHLRTFLHEVAFHNIAPDPLDLATNAQNPGSWHSSKLRSEVLISCLNAAKEYVFRYISISTKKLWTATFPDYAKLVYNVLILKSFTTWVNEEHLPVDETLLQKSANFAYYMEALVQKFESLGRLSRECGLVEDYTVYLVQLFRSYERQTHQVDEDNGSSSAGVPGQSLIQMLQHSPTDATLLSPEDLNISTTLMSAHVSGEHWEDLIDGW